MIVPLITGFMISTIGIVGATTNTSTISDTENPALDPITVNNSALANNSSHFTAEVFVHKNFTGNSTLINENTPNLSGQFQDSISSLIISTEQNQSDGYMIEVCEHKSYTGNCMILGPGSHNVQVLDWLNDQITSIRALSPQALELKNISPGIITNGSN
jgi:Beta/Gamma crystallin